MNVRVPERMDVMVMGMILRVIMTVMLVRVILMIVRVRVGMAVLGRLRRGVCVSMIVLREERLGFCLGQLTTFEHVNLGGRDATSVHGLELQVRAEAKRGGCILEDAGRNASADESAEKHVARNSGEAVQISNAHRFRLSMRGRSREAHSRAAAIAEAGSTSFIEPLR